MSTRRSRAASCARLSTSSADAPPPTRIPGRADPAADAPGGAGGPASVAAAALAAALLWTAGAPASAASQLRRAPDVPYVPDAAGELLVGVGAGRASSAEFPLSGLEGDLTRLGSVTLSYSYAPGAVLHVSGDARRVLDVESRGPSSVPLDADVEDGTTSDVGDFRLSTLARLVGEAEGVSAGLHVAVTLPNSDERKGIGTNTTDVAGRIFGSWAGGPLRFTGDVGVAILEAPTEAFVQNDVVVYAAEALYRPEGRSLALALSARGRASTRGFVPVGTEDRGRLRLQAEMRLGGWRLDGGVTAGYAGTSPDWGLEAGVARVLGL